MDVKQITVSAPQVAAARLKLKRAAQAGRSVDQAVRAIAAARTAPAPSR